MNRFLILAMIVCLPAVASAQTQSFTIKNGKMVGAAAGADSASVAISDDQKLMLGAAAKVMARDFAGAQTLYSQAIAKNSGNTEAYLQRGIVRRELKDTVGMESDARTAITLVNSEMQTSRNPRLYYQRAMGLRLLRQFDAAKQDLRTGMQQGGDTKWETDLKAIELEEKMAQQ